MPEHIDSDPLKTAYEIADRFTWSSDELDVYDYWSMKAQDERGPLRSPTKKVAKKVAKKVKLPNALQCFYNFWNSDSGLRQRR